MKNLFIVIICLMTFAIWSTVSAVNKATKPYNFTSHTTALSDQVNEDLDSVYVPVNKAIDTQNHWNAFHRGDSLYPKLRIDTLRGNPNIDSISGKLVVSDSLGIGTIPTTKFEVSAVDLNAIFKSPSAGSSSITIQRPSGNDGVLAFKTGSSFRWKIGANVTAELGGNSGSDLKIESRSDAGSLTFTPIFIKRSTGNVGINKTDPIYSLDVSGRINCDTLLASYYSFQHDTAFVISGKPIFTDTVNFMNLTLFGSTQGLIYIGDAELNYQYNTNENTVGFINYSGYLGGTTQYRDLSICNGKNKNILFVDGSDSSVTVPKLNANRVNADTLSATYIARDTSFACSLFDGTTYRATATARAQIIGRVATIRIPFLSGSITAATNTFLRIPSYLRTESTTGEAYPTNIEIGTTYSIAQLWCDNDYHIRIMNADFTNLAAGTLYVTQITITYFIN